MDTTNLIILKLLFFFFEFYASHKFLVSLNKELQASWSHAFAASHIDLQHLFLSQLNLNSITSSIVSIVHFSGAS